MSFFHIKEFPTANPIQSFLEHTDGQMTSRGIRMALPAHGAARDFPLHLFDFMFNHHTLVAVTVKNFSKGVTAHLQLCLQWQQPESEIGQSE